MAGRTKSELEKRLDKAEGVVERAVFMLAEIQRDLCPHLSINAGSESCLDCGKSGATRHNDKCVCGKLKPKLLLLCYACLDKFSAPLGLPCTPEEVEAWEKANPEAGWPELPDSLKDPDKMFHRGRALMRAKDLLELARKGTPDARRLMADKLEEYARTGLECSPGELP